VNNYCLKKIESFDLSSRRKKNILQKKKWKKRKPCTQAAAWNSKKETE